MKEQPMSDEKPMGQVIQIDEARIRDHLGEMVRGTVEETLNAMLDAEADQLCGAGRYERSEARQDTRAGSYERTLQTSAGEVNLKVPKLRRQTFETAIIERYRRRESSVEEALIEMYLAGISVRRVEDITEALWGTRVSPSTVSNLNKKIYAKIEAWRTDANATTPKEKTPAGDRGLKDNTISSSDCVKCWFSPKYPPGQVEVSAHPLTAP
jgi:putative transposase